MGYVPALCVLNLVLLISSTACLYLGSIMVNIYLLPYLHLISSNFNTVPYLILAIGGLLLLVSVCGIIAAGLKSRAALICYAILLGLAFGLQLASIFTAMELRNQMQLPRLFETMNTDVYEEMKLYWVNDDVKFKWDTLQRDYQCCGAYNLMNGFQDWQRAGGMNSNSWGTNTNTLSKNGDRLPDSCCIEEEKGCAKNIDFADQMLYEKINLHGCFAILRNRYTRDISPVLMAYIISGVVLALITIVTIVLAAAFVAAITRSEKQDRDGLGMYQMPGGHNAGTNRYEDTTLNKPYADTLDSGIMNGSLRSLRSHYSQLQEQPIIKGDNFRSSHYIEPSNEAGTVI